MNKTDLAKSVRDRIRFKKKKRERQQFLFPEFDYDLLTRKRAAELVQSTFEIITNTLEKGDYVLVSGFGKFQVRFKWARKGRNPKTGEPIVLDSHRVVVFHSSKKLREKINQKPE
ncbi:MAG: integration host factor subunit alpha [Deltaproteobacteria bacterium]|nr:integration host factor subunit alpha [Deltaproteobacteria bacterium]